MNAAKPVPSPAAFFHSDIKLAAWNPAAPATLSYSDGRKGGVSETPGLFWYSGFGYGTLYLPDGSTVWCDTSRAAEYCRLAGLALKNEDPLKNYSGTYLGD